ncbi:MAG: putative Ig domain-containing protein, partial [Dehalococcoidia bacterium]|nr:putative Ig domain-containing protein [Dehalococcoidia bacterium]
SNDCYEDVIVSDAGTIQVNGTHVFNGMLNGKPSYVRVNYAEIYYIEGKWIVTSGGHGYSQISSAATPPATGWELAGGTAPAPTLSGGEACSPCTAPQLSGTPPATMLSGSLYDFTPTTSGTCAITVFTVTNLPAWAGFNSSTGRLSGTPNRRDVGFYQGIVITAFDASNNTDTIGPFSIEVSLSLQVVPLGAGGVGSILDRVPATTQIGLVGIESFRLLDVDGMATCVSPLHLCIYETDYSAIPPVRTLIDYRFIPCDPVTGTYDLDIPMYALLSPVHDVVLAFADEPVLDTYGLPSVWDTSSGSLADSEDAPITVYEVGETITGRCQILIGGMPSVTSYIHLYFYSLDLSTRPTTLALLDHWVLRCGSGTSIYSLEIATDELAAGDYSIRLVFEDGSTEHLQIQLIEPTI